MSRGVGVRRRLKAKARTDQGFPCCLRGTPHFMRLKLLSGKWKGKITMPFYGRPW